MVTIALLMFLFVLTSLPAFYAMSLENDVQAENGSTTTAPSAGGQEVRKIRQIEAELQLLRKAVTESKSGAQCGAQSLQPNTLNEVTKEIQALRSQFHALQLQRELSVLRSDLLLAQSGVLADHGGKSASVSIVRTSEAGNDDSNVNHTKPSLLTTAGVVYKRWGHEGCPNNTELVYSGIIGGSNYEHSGGAANALCLPMNPVLERNPGASLLANIYGAEYETQPLADDDLDPLCAVCRIPRATVLMVPAASACHHGWTLEYSGYLMAGHHTHKAATEFICVDGERHVRARSEKSDHAYLFYFVSATCGSLPCPPYENGKILPCAVCSK